MPSSFLLVSGKLFHNLERHVLQIQFEGLASPVCLYFTYYSANLKIFIVLECPKVLWSCKLARLTNLREIVSYKMFSNLFTY